ncbi:MAG TPA: VWA domain-containing protein [Vicinamibacteria bacterium]|nr:VWA domain-containing protein [Vicinamibacteria bacterium]
MLPLPLPFLWLALAPAPQATPSFPTAVEVITVDAVVVDKDDRPVTGLTRAEFRVLEDGQPREIVSFEEYARGETPIGEEETAPPPVATNARGTELRGRAFALLLDDVFTPIQDAPEVRRGAERFLRNSAGPGDEVTISTTSGNAYWSAGLPEGLEDLLAVVARFKGRDTQGRYGTQEYGEMRIDMPSVATENVPESVRFATLEYKRMTELQAYDIVNGRQKGDRKIAFEIDHIRRQRMKITLAAVRRQLDALATVRGRKSLVLMSPGFLQDDTPDIRETAAASRRANTALYFVDVRGLTTQNVFNAADKVAVGPTFTALTGEEAERNLVAAGTQTLAQDTGGFSVRNVNDFASAAARIASESRSYYLLGIHPAEGKGPRDWRKLTVEVARPGLKVRSRRGYSLRDAPPPEEEAKGKDKAPATRKTLDPAVAGALDAAHAVSGIPLRAMVYVMEPAPKDKTRVLVAAEFDPRDLGRGGSSAKLGFSVNITHRDTGLAFESNERVEVKLGEGAPTGWRAMAREFLLPAGVASARVVVHDPATGAMGAVTQRIEVPPASVFRVSTPILSDQVDRSGKKPQAAVAVHREFLASGQLFCQFEVLGAARGPQGPRVAAGLFLRAADGTIVRKGELTPISADPDGRVVRLIGMGLAGMKEGPYDLVLDVRDEVSGQQIQRSEPFTLTPSS